MLITPKKPYINLEGDEKPSEVVATTKSGALGTALALAGNILGNNSNLQTAQAQAELEADRLRRQMVANSMNKKKNTVAIVILSGVFLVGGVAVFFALKK